MSMTSLVAMTGSRRRSKLRTTQIDDEYWLPALKIAAIRHESLAAIMRNAVRRYVERHHHLLDEPDQAAQ
jgi:hypothetical protein